MNKLWGNVLFGLARIVDFVFGHLANGAALCAGVLYNFRQGCAPFLFLLVLLALGMPFYGMILFLSLGRWLIPILLILLLPFVFAKLTVVLHRFHYICSEYLYDRADYHRLGVDHRKT